MLGLWRGFGRFLRVERFWGVWGVSGSWFTMLAMRVQESIYVYIWGVTKFWVSVRGIPIITIVVLWGQYWGPSMSGNYHIGLRTEFTSCHVLIQFASPIRFLPKTNRQDVNDMNPELLKIQLDLACGIFHRPHKKTAQALSLMVKRRTSELCV